MNRQCRACYKCVGDGVTKLSDQYGNIKYVKCNKCNKLIKNVCVYMKDYEIYYLSTLDRYNNYDCFMHRKYVYHVFDRRLLGNYLNFGMTFENPYKIVWNNNIDKMLFINNQKVIYFLKNEGYIPDFHDIERFKRWYTIY